jgi:hypothetical protein
MRQPDEIGGAETQCSYFVVSDLDSHYARAREAGANIIVEIKAYPNGSRGYTCADHEGHLWNFGTYDPSRQTKDAIRGAAAAQSGGNPVLPIGVPKDNGFSWRSVALARITTFVFGAILALALVASWQPTREAAAAPALPRLDARAIKITHQLVAFEGTTRRIAERRSASARNELVQERALRAAAEETAEQLKQQLSGERRAKDLAVSTMILPRQKLTQTKFALADERSVKDDAQLVTQIAREGAAEELEEARKQLAIEHNAHAAAELATKEIRDALARERGSRRAAKRQIDQLKKRLAMVEGASLPHESSNTAVSRKFSKNSPHRTTPPTVPAASGWDLSHGPAF